MSAAAPARLLAVDAGLRFGLASFDGEGRLLRYRSQHVPTRGVLRQAVLRVFGEYPQLACLVVEGGGDVAEPWLRAAARRDIPAEHVAAETWRGALLRRREHSRGARVAKRTAEALAREIIRTDGAPAPTSLRHDAAEAICLGHWAVNRC